ncbi:hypothetical protein [Bradyrhizobium sp.]|uniref:hypothetical protein n=1 Tax=Bradyrhizobium sp. TaxID=376 RepID=UPI0040379DE5
MSKIGGDRKSGDSGEEIPGDEACSRAGREEAATFIADMVADLSRVAERHGLDMLRHLRSMTQLEAAEWCRNKRRLS